MRNRLSLMAGTRISLVAFGFVLLSQVGHAAAAQRQPQFASKPEFDVLSIRHSWSGFPSKVPRPIRFRGGRLTCEESLGRLIRIAYHLEKWEYSGPLSLEFEYYVVQAIAPPGTSTADRDLMLQTMLEQRLGLKYHFQEKQLPTYALLVGKDGLRLPAGTPEQSAEGQRMSAGVFRSNDTTLGTFASFLTYNMDRPVFDMTGATGRYRINLDWSGYLRSAPPDPDMQTASFGIHISRPPVLDAGQVSSDLRKLGLRLEQRKVGIRVLVVDHVNTQPTAN